MTAPDRGAHTKSPLLRRGRPHMTAPDRGAHTKSPLLRRGRPHMTLGTRSGLQRGGGSLPVACKRHQIYVEAAYAGVHDPRLFNAYGIVMLSNEMIGAFPRRQDQC